MKKLWWSFVAVMVLSFLVLGWIGTRIYQEMPPIPDKVVTTDGKTIIDTMDISLGQNVWQSLGGMEVGSVWGHGSYVAPDWTADWLHREAVFILDHWANDDFSKPFKELTGEQQAQLTGRLTSLIRSNTYDSNTKTITIEPIRAEAYKVNLAHYSEVFSAGNSDYAIQAGAVDRSRSVTQTVCFFLLEFLGCLDKSTKRQHQLHKQLAPRATCW